jgi:hypothetical protein
MEAIPQDPQDFLPTLRQILRLPPSLDAWRMMRRLFEAWPGGEEKLMALDYADAHLRRWENALRVVYKVDPRHPLWTLARTLDVSLQHDHLVLLEALKDADTLKHIKGLCIRLVDWQKLPPDIKKKLQHLQELTMVRCRNTQILTLDASHLPNLQSLHLRHCEHIERIEGIEGFTQLRELLIQRPLVLQQADFLRALPHLENLSIHSAPALRDILPLSSLTALQRLSLRGLIHIRDLSPLAALTSLQKLYFSDGKFVKDLSPLHPLKQLTHLEICGLQSVEKIELEQELPQLREATLRCASRIQHKTLEHAELTSYYLSYLGRLHDITLTHLPQLRSLSLKGLEQLQSERLLFTEPLPPLSYLLLESKKNNELQQEIKRQSEITNYLQSFLAK